MAWDTLLEIKRANIDQWNAQAAQAPIFCPRCGYPLRENHGILDCALGDYHEYSPGSSPFRP